MKLDGDPELIGIARVSGALPDVGDLRIRALGPGVGDDRPVGKVLVGAQPEILLNASKSVPTRRKHIVVVDDNPGDAEMAVMRLVEAPALTFDIETAGSLAQAIALLDAHEADAVILDLNLPDSRGLETLRRIRAAAGEVPIIVVSGTISDGLRIVALEQGAEDVFNKDEMNNQFFYRSVLYVIERNRARLQHRRLAALLDAMPDAILVADGTGAVKFVNQSAAEMFGRTREELMAEPVAFALNCGGPREISIDRGGEFRSCELRVAQLEWDGNASFAAIICDVHARNTTVELVAHSLELELENSQIQEASRLKSEFLANVSHEIRTPMNAIIGLSHVLKQTELGVDQRSLLAKIQIASRAMMEIINNVLDLSKIEAGAMVFENLQFDLHELIHDLSQVMAPLAEGKQLDLVVESLDQVPQMVFGDVMRVRQILTNLLGNAIKFTEKGRVTLAVRRGERREDCVVLTFSIRDTGIGISPEVQGRLFTPFSQADASTTRRFGGSGLGLSIVRRLTEMIGGEIAVKSEMGTGSEFEVTLPFSVGEETASGSGAITQVIDVLLAEDGAASRSSLRTIALRLGWSVDSVGSVGALQSRLRERLRTLDLPGAVVIDLADGVAEALPVLARLREEFGGDSLPPCVVVVPAEQGDVSWMRQAGVMDVAVARPGTAVDLFNAVNAALVLRMQGRAEVMLSPRMDSMDACWLSGVRVLVVDDSEVNLEVAQRILEREGAIVVACESGRSALDRLRVGPSDFDVVLMDVQMPEMDGNEVARALREIPELSTLTVIALTAGALVAERQRSLDAGMDDFISKPLDPDVLIRVLRRHVERARGSALRISPRRGSEKASSPAWPHIEGIDGPDAARRLGGDISLFSSMLGVLLRSFDDMAVLGAAEAGNEQSRRRLAAQMHKLRGSAGMLGARKLQRLAADAESALRRETCDSDLAVILLDLTDAFTALATHARPFLDVQAQVASARLDAAERVPLQRADLAQLHRLLLEQNLAALDHFRSLSASLRSVLPKVSFDRLCRAMDDLDLVLAADLLKDLEAGMNESASPTMRRAATPDSAGAGLSSGRD